MSRTTISCLPGTDSAECGVRSASVERSPAHLRSRGGFDNWTNSYKSW